MSINMQERYLQVQVQTATPEMLITMLMDGAVRFLRQAKTHLAAGRVEATHRAVIRAQDIVAELNAALDMEKGGEVAAQLRRTYEMLLSRLVDANARKDPALLDQLIGHLLDLRRAWVEAVRAAAPHLRAGAAAAAGVTGDLVSSSTGKEPHNEPAR